MDDKLRDEMKMMVDVLQNRAFGALTSDLRFVQVFRGCPYLPPQIQSSGNEISFNPGGKYDPSRDHAEDGIEE